MRNVDTEGTQETKETRKSRRKANTGTTSGKRKADTFSGINVKKRAPEKEKGKKQTPKSSRKTRSQATASEGLGKSGDASSVSSDINVPPVEADEMVDALMIDQ